MSELVTEKKEIDCPHCKGKIDVEIQKQKPKVILKEDKVILKEDKIIENQTEIHEHKHEEPKNDPHDELAKMLPKGVNFGKCKGENCGKKIANAKGLTTKFKTCTNCKSNTVPKNNDFCPTCGKEPEDWDDSEVELEIENE